MYQNIDNQKASLAIARQMLNKYTRLLKTPGYKSQVIFNKIKTHLVANNLLMERVMESTPRSQLGG